VAPAETGVKVPAQVEKPNVAQSVPTEVPKELLSPTTGKKAQNQSALLDAMRNGDFPGKSTQHLRALTHEVHNQNILRTAARRLANDNPQLARDVFFSGALKTTNPDAHVALGRVIAHQIAKSGESPNSVMAEFQGHATNLGQGMRALHEDLLTPEGAVSRAMKVADLKGKQVTQEQVSQIEQMVEKINKMPDGAAKEENIAGLKTLIDNPSTWNKAMDFGSGVVSLPRAIMASTDLSFGLRQGMVLGSRFPGIWAKAQAVGARSAVDPKFFEAMKQELAGLTDGNGIPLIEAAKRAGVDLEAVFGKSEEIFGNPQLAEKLPLGAGAIVRGSDRAFSIAASYMRMQIFKRIVDGEGGVNAIENAWNTKQLKLLGRVINTGTGRGHGGEGGWFEKAAPILGKTLFSARLWKSRLDLINPLYYAALRKNPVALKLAVQSTASFGTLVGVTLAAAAAAGATVETDMRSSDFGKIKIGNTRYDIMGGLQQNLVLAWRELSGQYKSSSTGQITDLNSGKYGKLDRLSIVGRTVENKLAPVIAETIRQIQGKDISGKPMSGIDRLKEASGLVIPLNVQDTYSLGKDAMQSGDSALKATGKAALEAALPGTFGVGVQTYRPTASQQANTALGNPQKTSDKIKEGMAEAVVNINGQKMKWNDLSAEQKLALAKVNKQARGYYEEEQALQTAYAPNKLHPQGLSPQSTKVLDYFDHLTAEGKNKVFAREPGAQYAYDQAKFEEDKLLGKFTDDSQLQEAQQKLDRSKTLSVYPESDRHLYGRTKGEIETYLATQPNSQALFNDLIAMDDALYNAGVITSHKFRNKYGTITLTIGKSGSGSSSGGSGSRRRSSTRRSSGGGRARSISVSKYQHGATLPHKPNVRRPRVSAGGRKVALRGAKRGKIKVSIIKNTT
jgi:hypothetical protein